MYTAVRAIEEKADALRRIAQQIGPKFATQQTRLEGEARECDRRCEVIRQVLAGN